MEPVRSSPPVTASATADSAASSKGMPKAGLADGANTTWSTARKPVQVAEAPKRSAALDFKAIDKAVDDLQYARLRFAVASRNYAEARKTMRPKQVITSGKIYIKRHRSTLERSSTIRRSEPKTALSTRVVTV